MVCVGADNFGLAMPIVLQVQLLSEAMPLDVSTVLWALLKKIQSMCSSLSVSLLTMPQLLQGA